MSKLPDDLGPRLRKSLNHGTPPELSPDVISGAADRTPAKMANPRRALQVASGATVLVAAVAVAAIVIGPTLNRAPLFTVASSASANHAAGGSADANVPSVHGLMRVWANYVYHAGPGLSTSGGNGDVYQLVRSGSGTDRIDALASTFDLGGQQVTKDDSDKSNPTYTIGEIDGSTPALYLTWSGTGDWSYSDLGADPTTGCPPTTGSGGSSSNSGSGSSSSAPDASCAADQSSAADNAPTGDAARAAAQKLFAETGLTVSQSDIQLQSDSTQTTATANLEVSGVKTALGWGVTWASSGKIASAYGSSVTVNDRGSYGTISAADAVSRLTDSRWSGEAGPKYSGGIRPFAMLNSGVGTVAGSAPTPLPISSPAPYTDPSGAPTAAPGTGPSPAPTATPAEPTPPTDIPTPNPVPTGPPTINVTVNTADPTLLLMWDSNGNGWLVPGYAMKVENGFWNSVVSLVPGVIELPPLPTVEPEIATPAAGN